MEKLSDADYVRNLAERLMRIPVMYGTNGYDIDRLHEIAKTLDRFDDLPDPERNED